jgi:eukaryotic-like serine/threonine-protein kinase
MLTVREGFRLGLGRSGRRDSQQAAAFMVPVFEGQTKFAAPSRADSWSLNVPADPRVIVFVAAPIRGSDRRVLGSLVFAKLWSLGFSQILTVARAGASGETYAVSPDGVMLSESRFDNALKKTGLLPDESNAESVFRVQVRDPGGDLTNGYKPGLEVRARPLTRIASAAIASRDKTPEQQSGIILEPYRDYRGIDVIGAWRWLPEYDFAIVTEVDASEAFTPVGHITRAFKLLLGLVGLFAGLMLLASICLARAQQRGLRLGQYTLLRQLGEGGTSEVYLARHSLLRRPTAVKLLKTSWETPPGTVQRLEMEAKAISRLTHPNTIELYDFARTSEGIFYYAMEYLPGLNLAELVSLEGPVPEARVVHILKQICGSLREAHQQGLVHRDIKPMNIMLCERGGDYDFVKVLDFGLALQVGESIGHAEPNRIAGTMLYMAPECFSRTCETDVRSDIYSVGAVTYHLLLGRPAFQSVTELDLLNQILQGQPDSIAEHLPRPISPELERLVMDCLDKDPSRRPQSISVLLEVLDSIRNLNPWTQQEARAWWARCAPGLMRAPEVSKR